MLSNWRNWKIVDRTEWQAFLVSVAVLVANRFFELGMTESDVYAMFGGSGTYALSRGVAKAGKSAPVESSPAPVESSPAPVESSPAPVESKMSEKPDEEE